MTAAPTLEICRLFAMAAPHDRTQCALGAEAGSQAQQTQSLVAEREILGKWAILRKLHERLDREWWANKRRLAPRVGSRGSGFVGGRQPGHRRRPPGSGERCRPGSCPGPSPVMGIESGVERS